MKDPTKMINKLHAKLEVKLFGKKDKGVVSLIDIKKAGQLVIIGRPKDISKLRTDMSFQVGPNMHVNLDDPAERVNHSCHPNMGVKINEWGGYSFYSRRPIKKGEELTWCYPTTEYESIAVKECLCESKNCQKKVTGWESLSVKMKTKFIQEGYIGSHILLLENQKANN